MAGSADPGWESLFWMVFERSTNAVLLLDERRRILEANDPALRMLGVRRSSLVGQPITNLIASGEQAESWTAWERLLSRGEYSGRRTLLRSDASGLDIEFAARMATVDGKRRAVYVVEEHSGDEQHRHPGDANAASLTAREREVVTLIAMGETTVGIAAELVVSPETVKSHVRNAMTKLGVHTRAQLVAACLSLDAALSIPRAG